MSGVVTAVVGTAVVGGIASHKAGKAQAKASEQAAEYEYKAAQEALAFQKERYADIRPYLMKSLESYQALMESPETFRETPGYMFRLQEGLKAIGIPEGRPNLSGAQLKAATQYAQDYASAEYGTALSRAAGLGDLAQGVGATGAQYGAQIGNLLRAQGQARAQGTLGAAQARSSALLGIGRSLATGLGALGMIYNPAQQQQTFGGGAGYGAGYGAGGSIYQ